MSHPAISTWNSPISFRYFYKHLPRSSSNRYLCSHARGTHALHERARGMAWRSSGDSNATLIENLAANDLIQSTRVKDAMLAVDRAHFAPARPYEDSPQPLGRGTSATISAPHMHASAAEALLPLIPESGRARILDLGSGSGYLTAIFAALAGDQGITVGVDHIQTLVDLSRDNMQKSAHGRAWLQSGRVRLYQGDGRLGWREDSVDGWDAIHVGAAAQPGVSDALVAQLNSPGRLFIPIESRFGGQHIWLFDKDRDGKVTKAKQYGVMYVPLTDAPAS